MIDETARKVVTTVRLHAVDKELEKYQCVPVILIGVKVVGNDTSTLTFSLDSTLTLKENLTIINAVQKTLTEQVAKISITNIKS